MTRYIYVLSTSGKPLMPTTRKGHVRRLLNKGKARIISHVPFVIQLKYESPGICQPLYGGTDPGRTNIGEAVITGNGKCVYLVHVTTRNKDIPKLMAERRQYRQASRRGERQARKRLARKLGTTLKCLLERKLPGYGEGTVTVKDIINTEAKFNNRVRPDEWLTPTARQLVQTHINMAEKICRILPVTHWSVEINRFAFMKMEDGTVYGTDFQNGRMKGYPSVKEYVYARQEGRCPFCGGEVEHYHHIVPKHMGGSNLPENIVGLCKECHEKIHTGALKPDWKGILKKYGALSVLNQAIPYILKSLVERFGKDNIGTCPGHETERLREALQLPKEHENDALCIAGLGAEVAGVGPGSLPGKLEVVQFRRHNRQRIHHQTERTYYLDGKAVCKNRRPRFEQKGMSLAEYREEYPGIEVRLTVKKSRRYYNDMERVMPGAEFYYKGERYILSGQHSHGTQYRAYGQGKKEFPASKCRIVRHNTGLVYVEASA